ncbi:MAG: SpoVR family protein, partial [Candidatus Nanohaloarchaea archaeon]|nr:SpoVR family protein [Candidatus Nanohaloarchaea archaeon]
MTINRLENMKEEKAEKLEDVAVEARNLSEKLGLEPYPIEFYVVDYDEMNEIQAYGGFKERYPHWRFGMQYDQAKKKGRYFGGKVYELVANDDPAPAYLQESNDMADQKLVITHVEAHSDFFANNDWFQMYEDEPRSVQMLEEHGDKIEEYMKDPDIGRDRVERWIDNILTIEDNINQYREYDLIEELGERQKELEGKSAEEQVEELDIPDHIKERVFDDEWFEEQEAQQKDNNAAGFPPKPQKDIMQFLKDHGKSYDAEAGKAVEMEDWQEDVLDMLQEESYYFAPQKMTKVMNEGWAAYWHGTMMEDEKFADQNELITYGESNAGVLGAQGLNPYKLGKQLYQHIENQANRKEVAQKLLQVEDIDADNFYDRIDFGDVQDELAIPDELQVIEQETLDELEELLDDSEIDHENLEKAKEGEIDVQKHPWKVLEYEGLAKRNFSLNRPENTGFLSQISQDELDDFARYLDDMDRYSSIEEAIDDVDYTAGWDKIWDVHESHNDVTFVDEFLDQEFVDEHNYFAYENLENDEIILPVVTRTDAEAVKKKLLLQYTNFGKPVVKVHDGNFNNKNELLLGHHYNGVEMNLPRAAQVMERVYEMWGRDVHLKTIVKERDEEYNRKMEETMREIVMAKQAGEEPDIEIPRPDEQGML